MTLPEIVEYLEQEMPGKMTPEDLAAFMLCILSGYMGRDLKTMVDFLRDVADSVEASNVAPDNEA
jgi:hypothetical protein